MKKNSNYRRLRGFAWGRARTVVACIGLLAAQAMVTSVAFGGPTESWGLDRIDQRSLPLDGQFSPSSTGAGWTIWVVGTGVRDTHVDFGGRAQQTVNYGSGPNIDCNGQGTLMASIAAGSTWGVAQSAQVRGVRVAGSVKAPCSDDVNSMSALISGLDWIIANSGSSSIAVLPTVYCNNASWRSAVANLINAGVRVVAAAPDDGTDLCACNLPTGLIVVGATGGSDHRDCLPHGYGGCIDIYAPGDWVRGAWFTSDFAVRMRSGTEYAAAYVAGAIACNGGYSQGVVDDATLTHASVCLPADLDGNGRVGFEDLTALLSAWESCTECPPDLDGNGRVGFEDLTMLLSVWGPVAGGTEAIPLLYVP